MDVNVRPRTAVLVIALFAALLGLKFWADGRALDCYGPESVRADATGNLYVQVGNQLYKHDPDGEFVRQYDLGTLGVSRVLGDLAFLPDGELLIRRAPAEPSFVDNLAFFLRLKNRTPVAASEPETGLFRCNLDTAECVPFGEPPIDLGRTFHLRVDPREGVVYVSDTTRHVVRKLDLTGQQLAKQDQGFWFPNGLFLADGRLYVADMNHHRVRVVDPSTESFGREIDSARVDPPAAHVAKQTWPAMVVHQDDRWWVLNVQGDMGDGGVYVFDGDWQFEKRLDLPEHSEPRDLVAWGNRVLVCDARLGGIYQFDGDGERLVDVTSSTLATVLAADQAQRVRYEGLSRVAMASFIAALIAGFGLAIWLTYRAPSNEPRPSAEEREVRVDDPRIRWVTPDPKVIRRYKWLGLTLATMVAAPVALAFGMGAEHFDTPALRMNLVVPVIVAIVVSYLLYIQLRSRIGVLEQFLILQDHRGRHAVGQADHIYYNNRYVVIGPVAVLLGTGATTLFPVKDLVDEVYPRLRGATEVSARQMQTLLVKRWHPTVMIPLVGLLAFGVAVWLRMSL